MKKNEAAAEEKRKELNSITERTSLYKFKINDVILIKETGECTTIDGFTKNNKVVCRLNDEITIFDFDEIQLV